MSGTDVVFVLLIIVLFVMMRRPKDAYGEAPIVGRSLPITASRGWAGAAGSMHEGNSASSILRGIVEYGG